MGNFQAQPPSLRVPVAKAASHWDQKRVGLFLPRARSSVLLTRISLRANTPTRHTGELWGLSHSKPGLETAP